MADNQMRQEGQFLSERERLSLLDERKGNEQRRRYESDRTFGEGVTRDRRDYSRGVLESDRNYSRSLLNDDRNYGLNAARLNLNAQEHINREFDRQFRRENGLTSTGGGSRVGTASERQAFQTERNFGRLLGEEDGDAPIEYGAGFLNVAPGLREALEERGIDPDQELANIMRDDARERGVLSERTKAELSFWDKSDLERIMTSSENPRYRFEALRELNRRRDASDFKKSTSVGDVDTADTDGGLLLGPDASPENTGNLGLDLDSLK